MKKILILLVVGIFVLNGLGVFELASTDSTLLSVLINNYPINGTTLIADFVIGKIIEVDINGNVVWEYNEASTPIDVERLNNGNTLIVESYGKERVLEVDIDGNVVWEYKGETFPFHPADAERLQNGNTLITFGRLNQRGIIEVDINGNIVWEYDCTGLFYTGDLERLDNGNTLMIISVTENDSWLIEVDIDGNVVWEYNGDEFPFYPSDVERLQNGNTLIANYNGHVIEVDIDGEIVWEYNETNSTIDVERLYNGYTLIVDSRDARVIEVDNEGNLVWEYGMVNEPSDVERIDNQSPDAPSIDGPTKGKFGENYNYTFNSIDSDNHDIKFYVEWGDGSEWTDFISSGENLTIGHIWNKANSYTIRVKAEDIYGAESEWSIYKVSMSKIKIYNPILQLILSIFHRFPFFEKILNQII